MMTCLDLLRPGFWPAPFKRVAGPAPKIEGWVGMGFAFRDDYGWGKEAVGEKMGRYFCSQRVFLGVGCEAG